MGPQQYLIDTNVIIDWLGKKFPAGNMNFVNGIIDEAPNVSIITKIELLGFNAPEEYHRMLRNFMDDANILDLSSNVVDVCIELRKAYRIKLPDAIIAATSIACGIPLLTRNTADFSNIQTLKVINPWKY